MRARRALIMEDCDSGFGIKPGASGNNGAGQNFSNGQVHEWETSVDGQSDTPRNPHGQFSAHRTNVLRMHDMSAFVQLYGTFHTQSHVKTVIVLFSSHCILRSFMCVCVFAIRW